MRSLKEASKKIEDFQKDEEILRDAIQDLSVLSFEQLNIKYGINLHDFYKKIGDIDPYRATIFLDACFFP